MTTLVTATASWSQLAPTVLPLVLLAGVATWLGMRGAGR